MIRAFVAIPVPTVLLTKIEQVVIRLKRLGVDARFPRLTSIHLTLKFLGNIEETMIEPIFRALENVLKDFSPFEVEVRGIGVFPDLRRPRVVWLGLVPPGRLISLQRSVETGLRPIGFQTEGKRFQPHLTLARVRSPRHQVRLAELVDGEEFNRRIGVLPVESVHLYQSILKPEGAVYRSLANVPLCSSNDEAKGKAG